MSANLSIRLSDAALARLRQRAAEQGLTPEEVAAADLEREPPKSATDPLLQCIGMIASDAPDVEPVNLPRPGEFLRKWAGAVRSDAPDWADNHDEHLGRALTDELRGGEGGTDVR